MCINCWKEFGSPALDTPEIREAAELISAVYVDHPVGGRLHVVVDDWNLEDEHINLYDEANATDVERGCYEALKALSLPERASALALQRGLWS